MTPITYHPELIQGTDEWLATRCGMITASEIGKLLTSGLKVADNETSRGYIYELAAQRVTGYVEPQCISDDMLRGHDDEIEARKIYDREVAPLETVGFITNRRYGFTLGYSPDAIVGADGLIEVKSRRAKLQMKVLTECVFADPQTIPAEHMAQVQCGLLVTERQWCDYISYCGGLPMAVVRALPDRAIQDALLAAAEAAEEKIAAIVGRYEAPGDGLRLYPTKRIEHDMIATTEREVTWPI